MTIKTALTALLALSLSLSMIGCRSSPDDALAPAGEWLLVSIEGEQVDDIIPRTARPPIVRIEDSGAISGNAGVNRFTSRVPPADLAAGRFTLGPIASTRMAGTAEAMAFERRVLDALAAVDSHYTTSNTLTLDQGTTPVLGFERIETPD